MLVMCRAAWCFEMMFSKPSSFSIAFGKAEDGLEPLQSLPGGELLRALLGRVSALLCFFSKQWGRMPEEQGPGHRQRVCCAGSQGPCESR